MEKIPGSTASFSLQDRDLALLRDLFESRVMTSAHATDLHFDGHKEAAKKRLQKLKAAGLINERPRRAYEPAVLYLAQGGLSLLRAKGILAEYPLFSMLALEKRARVSDSTIRHELDVMDVKAALHAALRGNDKIAVAQFGTWPRLYEFEAEPTGGAGVLVKPDGFIRIREKENGGALSEHTFFLEVDRSTETQDNLASRAAAYLEHYKSGGFAVRNGASRSAFKEYPFRVLMVFKTAERRNNTASRLLQNTPPILTHVCLATIDEVRADPLGAIWIRPVDYRTATAGTLFDSDREMIGRGYQRQVARETSVEQRIEKRRLLEN